jgi:hypothetical protein
MALEYRFTKVALEVLAKAANPEIRVYSMGIEVLRSVSTLPSVSASSRMVIAS